MPISSQALHFYLLYGKIFLKQFEDFIMKEAIIKDYPNYKITENARIFSRYKFKTNIPCDTWREVKQVYDKSCGYMLVTLCDGFGKRQNKRVHRLLMEAFVPNPNNYPHINHIDGNKLHNSLDNLEWCTAQHNTREAIRLGLTRERELSQSIAVIQLDKDTLEPITEYESLHDITEKTDICWQNVWKVCNGIRKTAGGYKWKYKEGSETIRKE